jgi:hypothetical protein
LLPSPKTTDKIIRYQGMLRREVGQALRQLQSLQKERKRSEEMQAVREVFSAFGPRNGRGPEDLLGRNN